MTLSVRAQTPTATTTPAAAQAATEAAPVRLPYGVDEVLKLSRAQVSEDVILNYIHNSGTIYNLSAKDIVYLRNEGVSDAVVNAMLAQRENVPAQAATQSAAASVPATPQAPATEDTNALAATPPTPQYAPTYVQAAPVYSAAEPAYAPVSTVYVIPYYRSGYSYGNCYPYYYRGYYPYYYGPSLTFGFGFGYGGRGHYGGYYRGGYHGGGHYGGYRGHR